MCYQYILLRHCHDLFKGSYASSLLANRRRASTVVIAVSPCAFYPNAMHVLGDPETVLKRNNYPSKGQRDSAPYTLRDNLPCIPEAVAVQYTRWSRKSTSFFGMPGKPRQ